MLSLVASAAACALVLSACQAGTDSGSSSKDGGKYDIALSLSYTGNDWQDNATNLVKAAAKTAPYDKKVNLRVDIAGSEVGKQIQTLNNEISAGVDAIIVYPISPTALNATIKKACDAGIIVYAYDSLVTEPCAYNVHIDQYEWGVVNATWLAEELGGKGDIAVIDGVPGTTVALDRQKGLDDVLKKYPDMKVAGKAPGAWAQAQGKTAFTSIEAANPNLDGIFAQAGCYAITKYLNDGDKKVLPCAGEYSNGHHVQMLSPEVCKEVDIDPKECLHLPSISSGSPAYSGELAFINTVRLLDGEKVGRNTILPLPSFTTDDLDALGAKGVGDDPAKGALVFTPSKASPGMFGSFWSPLVEQGLLANLKGVSDKISDAKPCAEVEGCKTTDKLTFDDNHSGGN
ncbi:sugar ABC transporter substrate-binding protein [Aeromicrobium sp. A1-2]|uniref:substrate-binding domain-containing protein n=1 Tax=Aeromicrobium sp. A1-2 TaxID=2107713 RepID=UPI000E471751|nr:substrate-binding domain-containing protein [Aeromicrobium sp. A1-2]AXT86444.1 sugar ABC transporter substrate-binding protein [Aeromicrobium sp. A1-2]